MYKVNDRPSTMLPSLLYKLPNCFNSHLITLETPYSRNYHGETGIGALLAIILLIALRVY